MQPSIRSALPSRGRKLGLATAIAVIVVTSIALTGVAATAQDDDDTIAVGTASSDLGTFLAGPEGMSLYFFTRDVTPGVSVCNGPCADAWPPLLVEDGYALAAGDGVTGPLGVIERADGSKMAAYRGRPLYYFASDTAPGDTTGQDVGGIWFVALEDGSSPPNPPALTLGVAEGEAGSFLVGKDGMTVYMFTNDVTPGVSTCSGGCQANWPPVTVNAGNTAASGDGATGVVGVIPTADGAPQVTYNGMPLYYFSGDAAEGDTNGQGQGDVWWVVAP